MRKSHVQIAVSLGLFVLAIGLLAACGSQSPGVGTENLIQNPGFEDPDGNVTPVHWTASTTAPFRDSYPDVHSGNRSAYLHGPSGSFTQVVFVGANSVYRFESYTRANANATDTVTLTVRDSLGSVLDTYSGNGTDHGWARRIDYFATPGNAWDAVVTVGISGDADAEVWFDDVLVEEKTPTSWCFIATAAYGSGMDARVATLRAFRDRYLANDPTGRGLVSSYYRLSPPAARFIDDHPALKPVVRAGLLPAVTLAVAAVDTPFAAKMGIAGGLLCVSFLAAVRLRGFTGQMY